jgi:phosphatidylglycerophosphatase A
LKTTGVSASLPDKLAIIIATGFGAGYAPIAPGTFGSIVGLVIVFGLIYFLKYQPNALYVTLIVGSAVVALVGIWAATRAERILGKKDPGAIVIDEVCGQMITFVGVSSQFPGHHPWRVSPILALLLVGFLLFRAFDIFKPYPIRRLESLGSGLGVMADDVLAGIYASIILSFLLLLLGPQ